MGQGHVFSIILSCRNYGHQAIRRSFPGLGTSSTSRIPSFSIHENQLLPLVRPDVSPKPHGFKAQFQLPDGPGTYLPSTPQDQTLRKENPSQS